MDLRDKLETINKDWEKALFCFFVAVFTLIMAISLYRTIFPETPPPQMSSTGSSAVNPFGENAFAFLYGVPALDDNENPFNFSRTMPRPKKDPHPQTTQKETQKPPPPPPVKQGHIIQFNGWINVADGGKIALIKVFDLNSKKLIKSDTLAEGAQISEFTISKLEDTAISVKGKDGKETQIPIHKQVEIVK